MICAEDEIGVGSSHDGIIVLPATAVPGTLAKNYYQIKSDYLGIVFFVYTQSRFKVFFAVLDS
jgi:hypothetical protein